MGGASSTVATVQKDLQKSEKEVVRLMMPVYYISDQISLEERALASKTWNLILDDKSPEYLRLKGNPDFTYSSSVTFFYDTFYIRLFDIHPMSRQLFKGGMRSQGKFLVKMISLALSELDDAEKFDHNLIKLAEIHYHRGVKAVEYGIVGEILFWCLRHVLGQQCYLQAVHFAWVKVYSRMLTTIVPQAIAMELKGSSANAKERSSYKSSFIFETTKRAGESMAVSATQQQEHQQSEDNDDDLVSEKIRVAETTESAKSIAKSHSKLIFTEMYGK